MGFLPFTHMPLCILPEVYEQMDILVDTAAFL